MKTTQPRWPFERQDELHEQIAQLRMVNPIDPLALLHEWMLENVRGLTGDDTMSYGTLERMQYRLEVQHKILRMVEEGVLDEMLRDKDEINVTHGHIQEEEAHVPD